MLVACPGCDLNNPTKLLKRKHTKPNKRIAGLPCVFNIEHEETVSLKEFHKRALNSAGTNVLRCTYFHISHLIWESLRPHLASHDLTIVDYSKEVSPLHTPQYEIHFKYKAEFIKPSLPTRSFVKTIFDAKNFNTFMDLYRCNFISFLNNTRSIDWYATWNRFKNCSNLSKSHTSFKKSIHITFSSKLMLDELPLLYKLQTSR